MTIARLYRMIAADGKTDELEAALEALAAAVAPLPGCSGVDLLRDLDRPGSFVFIERWASVQAHKDAAPLLSKAALGPVMGAVSGRPDGAYLEYLPVGG